MNATALVVELDRSRLLQLRRALESVGCRVYSAESFQEARRLLPELQPDILVAPVRLGAFNGLHLVLLARHQQPATRAIIIGTADLDMEADATAAGAMYLVDPDPATLIAAARQLLAGAGPKRRWLRKPVERRVTGLADGAAVRIVDVSYGGMRLELEAERRETLTGTFRLQLPDFDVSAEAFPVWQLGNADTGTWTCGAAVGGSELEPGSSWRRFVDSVGEVPA